MVAEHYPAAVIALLDAVSQDSELISSAADAARATGRPGSYLPDDEVRRHVNALLAAVRAAAMGDPDALDAANRAADDLALDRVEQGVSLPVLLKAVSAARAVVLERLLGVGQTMVPPEMLLQLLLPMDAVTLALHNRMVLAYRAGERELARSTRAARSEALRELLRGGPSTWADEAGLDPAKRYFCMVADVSMPRDARRLEPVLETGSGVSAFVNGFLSRVTTELPALADGSDLVVHSPAVTVEELAGAAILCREALPHYRRRQSTGLQPMLGAALALATGGQPRLGVLLSDGLLTQLDPKDEFHRLLAETAFVYLQEGSRIDQVAGVLHVHPNTVKYRIRRFTELTGGVDQARQREGHLQGTVHWWWALSSWLITTGDRPAT